MAKPPVPLFGFLNDPKYLPRFMRFVSKPSSGDGCWLWTGGSMKNLDGTRRACFRGPGNCKSASRLAYAMLVGDVPDGLLVCHTCDNTMCVNPGHLYLGTHKQNTGDMIARGRSGLGWPEGKPRPRGYKRPFKGRVSKLTDDAVRAIRVDERRKCEIALAHGVLEVTVRAIRRRIRKAHVPDEPTVTALEAAERWPVVRRGSGLGVALRPRTAKRVRKAPGA